MCDDNRHYEKVGNEVFLFICIVLKIIKIYYIIYQT